MTGPRVEVKRSQLTGAAKITPRAAPVDRFVRTSEGSELAQIAKALGKISPEVARLGDKLFEVKLEKDIKEGAAAAAEARLAGHKTEADAIRAGALPANQSRAYRRSSQEVFGANAASDYGRALGEFISSDLSDVTDMDVVNERVAEFRENWIEQNVGQVGDKDFHRVFAQQAIAIESNSLMNVSWNVGKRFKEQTEAEIAQLAVNALTMEMVRTDFTPQMGIQALGAVREKAFDMGTEGKQVNEIIFTSVSEKAIAEGNPEMVEMLAMMPTGPNGSTRLVENPAYTLRLSQAYREAVSMKHFTAKLESAANDQEAIDVFRDLNDALLSSDNPASVDLIPFQRRMNISAPKQVEDLARHRQAVIVGMTREDDARIGELLGPMLYTPDNPLTEAQLRIFLSNETVSTRQYEFYRKKIKERDRIMADPSFARYRAAISRAKVVAADDLASRFGPITGPIPRAFMAQVKATLRTRLDRWAWEWKAEHPTALDPEVQDALAAETELLIVEMLAQMKLLSGTEPSTEDDTEQ